ncbi:3-dehydroquinate synthase [Sediminicoccus rosea]|uniref:Multifunctional fusion protein n=1 Tax=Sediminicoccus rosea TaxID=1225128 RepID=A0ABZ0PDX0_9PROT|nr:3-dehydroquinate synthase [Sediminicoccus rosea]WPB83410.1 3-dehydroquinate synthase [Sediminicoccus rosea]
MSRNLAQPDSAPGAALQGPAARAAQNSIVLVGMPGAGKSSIGRRLAARLGLPFRDADTEIEQAAGIPIAEIFARYGEAHFREGERRVIARLLNSGEPIVLATGGGAYVDPRSRAAIRDSGATALWLKCRLSTLLRRVAGRDHRPMFVGQDPREVLERLMAARHPAYAEADVTLLCSDEPPEVTTRRVAEALSAHRPPERLHVALSRNAYDIVIGEGVLRRAGAEMAQRLEGRRAVIVSDQSVAPLHLPTLRESLADAGFTVAGEFLVPPGEASKCFTQFERLVDGILSAKADRRLAVIALGGGVVGDLAGFAAAAVLRGLPFVQCPTTLLAQVDSSVGGKTGINTSHGKNLVGAFHQPRLVLADTATLRTLPPRELRAGWAEVAKHGLLQGPLWEWCESEGPRAMQGDPEALAYAVLESCRLKSAVVVDDEFEMKAEGGRALLNLGHTFGHALEAECGYGGELLHGEAVAIGLGLATELSARLGLCSQEMPGRVREHLREVGLPNRIAALPRRFSVERLIARMRADKKARDGAMRFVLLRAPGDVFTESGVTEAMVRALLSEEGCEP